MTERLDAGAAAPAFTLPDQHGKPVSLSDFRGGKVILYFYPEALTEACTKRFGSGWAWLVPGKDKPLAIVSTPNQDNPQMEGGAAPILGCDVWEHAYYLKYRNLRAKYVETFLEKLVNWDFAAANFK